MGTCVYCGKPAGLFKTEHAECKERDLQERHEREAEEKRQHDEWLQRRLASDGAAAELAAQFTEAIFRGEGLLQVDARAADLVADGVMNFESKKAALVKGWQQAVSRFLDDGVLTLEEEERLMQAKERFMLTTPEVGADGSYGRVAFASQLRRIANGEKGIRVDVDAGFPVNFQAGETPVWSFGRTEYYEERDRRKYQGRSRGVSVRVVSGVYVRLGAFSGEPVISTETVHVDTGIMVMGSKNLYFVGPAKSLRIPYPKIVSITRYADGVGLHRDAASAKPQAFKTGDGWAVYNMLSALCRGPATES